MRNWGKKHWENKVKLPTDLTTTTATTQEKTTDGRTYLSKPHLEKIRTALQDQYLLLSMLTRLGVGCGVRHSHRMVVHLDLTLFDQLRRMEDHE